MGFARHHGQPGRNEHGLDPRGAILLAIAFPLRHLEVPDRCGRAGADRRRQGRREDETRRIGPHRVDQVGACRDIAAEATERLGERPLDHVDPVHRAVARRDARARRPVHADGVDLVQISHRAVTLGEIADAGNRRRVAVHRIEALERDQLRPARRRTHQQFLEMDEVVVAPDLFLDVRAANAFDHRVVVPRVGQDQAVRQQRGDRGDAGFVGHVSGREDERGLLAVQIGELALELDQRVIGPGDVAGPAGARAHPGRRLHHGANHLRVLAHAEIVVRAPDDHVARPRRGMPAGMRKTARDPLEVGEHAIALLVPEPIDRSCEKRVVDHELEPPRRFSRFSGVSSCLGRRPSPARRAAYPPCSAAPGWARSAAQYCWSSLWGSFDAQDQCRHHRHRVVRRHSRHGVR